ncbi:MerR family DNA-binding transcriptional regulator [Micromonospora sp. NPDC000668]|uniref:MerR family DNA-binding transcriptional regulator n=1 Tax=Micromonospora sp. NPDC000668 TaxID=3364219 RepID=UPI0036C62377
MDQLTLPRGRGEVGGRGSAELSIGEFAKMTFLSVKQLRNYHEMGLLEPAVVDSVSGYRYDDVSQVATARVIHPLLVTTLLGVGPGARRSATPRWRFCTSLDEVSDPLDAPIASRQGKSSRGRI